MPIKVRSVKHKEEEDTIDDTAEPNEAIHLTDTTDPTDTRDPTRILEPWRLGFWIIRRRAEVAAFRVPAFRFSLQLFPRIRILSWEIIGPSSPQQVGVIS